MLRLASVMRRAPRSTAAAVASLTALAQPSSPSECSWFFGKSKDVLQLEAKNEKLEDTVKRLETENKDLEEKVNNSILTKLTENFPTDTVAYAKEKFGDAVEAGVPQEISYGFAAGACAGYATKIALKVAAAAAGGVFCFLQILQYNDIIKINHARLSQLFKSLGDMDGDGNVDAEDIRIAKEKYLAMMGHGLATGSGFTSGFLLGVRRG